MHGWLFLSGMMGCGKSTVARAIGERLGVPVVDLDARVAQRAGSSIPEIFAREGEEAFRALEAEEIERVLEGDPGAVVALGGGTITREATRRRLLSAGVLVTLRAPAEELVRRVAGAKGRPLLSRGDTLRVLEGLIAERAPLYAECHGAIDTEGRGPDDVALEAIELWRRWPIPVALGLGTYRVEIGAGARARLPEHAGSLGEVVILVSDENVFGSWGGPFAQALEALGRRVVRVVLAPGEENKTLAAVERIWDDALAGGVDRRSALVSVGGGVVGDLAGFAAATLMRGIRFAQVPTSLLAMVDASVGGKTGFDRSAGKNLVGAFHQPQWVICDLDTLATLPDAELRSGLAEVVKAAWLDGEAAIEGLERDAEALLAREPEATERAVRMAVALKARIVAEDEREGGVRRLLNLGHTLGHAIEAAHGFEGVRHGEAVALGMLGAFRVAEALGDASAPTRASRMRSLLERLGLPTEVSRYVGAETSRFLARDKKRAGKDVSFVVPGAPGDTRVVPVALATLPAALGLP